MVRDEVLPPPRPSLNLSIDRAVRQTHKLSTSDRPLSPRDFFIVQDYVLVKKNQDRPWFFTYNHDISHVRFPCACIEIRIQQHNDIYTDPSLSLPARRAREGRFHEDGRKEAGYGRCPTRRRQYGSELDVALEYGFQRHGPSRFVVSLIASELHFCPSLFYPTPY